MMSPFSEEFNEYADFLYDQKADRLAERERRTAMKNLCTACGLPEDGLRVRNVSPRPGGAILCHDCWKESGQRKAAQEQYIRDLAADRGETTEQLETMLMVNLCAGAPDRPTMTILTNMFHAAERVNAKQDYDEFAPDYDALAQEEPFSQIQSSREAAGLA